LDTNFRAFVSQEDYVVPDVIGMAKMIALAMEQQKEGVEA